MFVCNVSFFKTWNNVLIYNEKKNVWPVHVHKSVILDASVYSNLLMSAIWILHILEKNE